MTATYAMGYSHCIKDDLDDFVSLYAHRKGAAFTNCGNIFACDVKFEINTVICSLKFIHPFI